MKYFKNYTWGLILAGGLLVACAEDITIAQLDESQCAIGDGTVKAYLSDNKGKKTFTSIEFRNSGDVSFHLTSSAKQASNAVVSVTYDESVLTEYNAKNETAYEAFPVRNVTIGNNGKLEITVGSIQSSELKVEFTSDGSLSTDKTYVIPLRIKVESGNFQLTEDAQTRLIFVKDLTGIPDCTKYVNGEPGVKVFSCMEVNKTNPLNNLSFTLKSNGKTLVDYLIIFSANINYDLADQSVYIYTNNNVQALLDNREHYLKPLKDRGIKIILGLLGNHDRAGVSNMSRETAKAFAKKVKAMCDAYDLDGIFLDDEYSEYENGDITPGFVAPNNTAVAHLCYEVKKQQPDKLIVAYAYGLTGNISSVDGIMPGEFVDYALSDYLVGSKIESGYTGMPLSNIGIYSQEFQQGKYASRSQLTRAVANGYLSHMIFAMDPNNDNAGKQLQAMQTMAEVFYDDELVFDGIKYSKDWK